MGPACCVNFNNLFYFNRHVQNKKVYCCLLNNNHSKFKIYNLTNNNRSRLKKSKTHLFNTFSLFGKHLCNTFSLFGSAQQSINQVLLHTSLLLTLHCCIFLPD